MCRRVLFDTADGNQPEYFLNLKKSLNFDKLTIQDIILSHWHPDHVGGLKDILQFAEVSVVTFMREGTFRVMSGISEKLQSLQIQKIRWGGAEAST